MRLRHDEQPALAPCPLFDGPGLEPRDHERLGRQLAAVRALMQDGRWRTLAEIEGATGYPQASVSARLRDLRKGKHGGYGVHKRRRSPGTFEYRVAGSEGGAR